MRRLIKNETQEHNGPFPFDDSLSIIHRLTWRELFTIASKIEQKCYKIEKEKIDLILLSMRVHTTKELTLLGQQPLKVFLQFRGLLCTGQADRCSLYFFTCCLMGYI